MNIVEKLKLQHQLGGLVLFREGLFLRAYNESCYILTELLKQDLSVKCHRFKKLKNQFVVECVFPYTKLNKRLPKAELTAFGARLDGDFNLQEYNRWFWRHNRAVNAVREAVKCHGETLQTFEMWSSPEQELFAYYLEDICLFLNPKQGLYLSNWQKGKHSVEQDLNFIESLKSSLPF